MDNHAAPPRLTPLETLNVHQLVYQRLKEGIITNAFRPGEQLFVRDLASQLGTSTTPVVQAMLHLSQEGLVTILPRKGTFVTDLREEDIHLLFEAREAIETHAATLAAERATPQEIDELRTILVRWSAIRASLHDGVPSVDARPLFEADSRFHLRAVELAGNRYLDEMYRKVDSHVWAFTHKSLSRYHEPVQDVAHQGHLRIIDALAHRDAAGAAKAVRAHIWDVHVLYARLMQPGGETVATVTPDPQCPSELSRQSNAAAPSQAQFSPATPIQRRLRTPPKASRH